MAIAFVEGKTIDSTTGSATTAAFTNTFAVKQLVVVTIAFDGGSNTVTSITDNASTSNAYVLISNASVGNGTTMYLATYYAVITTAVASAQVTVNYNSTGTNANVAVQYFNGFTTAPTLDQAHAQTNASSTTTTSGATSATAHAAELVVGMGVHISTTSAFSLGTGYTNLTTGNVAARAVAMESKVVSSRAAQTATFTIAAARVNAGAVATFYDAVPNTTTTVALNTPLDTATGVSTTPDLVFTGTDGEGDNITYEVNVATSSPINIAGSVIDSYNETDTSVGYSFQSGFLIKIGQSFTANGGQIGTAQFKVKIGSGTPTGNAVATVYAHSGTFGSSGVPTGSALATSDTLSVSGITSSFAYITFTFSGANQIALTSGTHYFLVMEWTPAGGTIDMSAGVTPGGASGNTAKFQSSWAADSSIDTSFAIYVGPSSVVLDKFSASDVGFTDVTNGAHTDPFVSGDQVKYTVQAGSALTNGSTYYWRVRGLDPNGTGSYGPWTSTRSFTVGSSSVLTKTQTAVARVAITGTKTQGATARISVTATKTQTATARVSIVGLTKTQTAVSRISVVGLTKTQNAVARISLIRTKTQSATARVAITGTKTQSATARISNSQTRTQGATARISNTASRTQTAIARIAKSFTLTQTAAARIGVLVTKTQGAVARISATVTKTQSATSRIQATVTKVQSAVARIAISASKTQSAVARIALTRTKTQPATSRITNTATKSQTATARITESRSITQTAIARIGLSISKTQSAVARVAKVLTKTQVAVARISASLTKSQSATARVSITGAKTQGAVARIRATTTKTQSAVARVAITGTLGQSAQARVAITGTLTQTSTANILSTVTRSISQVAHARIAAPSEIIPPGGGPSSIVWVPEVNDTDVVPAGNSDGSVVWVPEDISSGSPAAGSDASSGTWTSID